MLITVSKPGRTGQTFCNIENAMMKSVQSSLEEILLPKNSKEATTSLVRAQVENGLNSLGWRTGLMIDNQISLEYPTANYTLDSYLDSSIEDCGHKHRFFSEFCFDNRQALGTNLLKFQVAAEAAKSHAYRPLGFMICADSSSIKTYGWDGAVASYQEYDHAIRIPYRSVLDEPPIIFSIRS